MFVHANSIHPTDRVVSDSDLSKCIVLLIYLWVFPFSFVLAWRGVGVVYDWRHIRLVGVTTGLGRWGYVSFLTNVEREAICFSNLIELLLSLLDHDKKGPRQ